MCVDYSDTKSVCVYRDRERERGGDGRGPVTVRVWPRIRKGTGYHAFYFLAFCPLAFCPLAFCPLAFCPLAFCPDTNNYDLYNEHHTIT